MVRLLIFSLFICVAISCKTSKKPIAEVEQKADNTHYELVVKFATTEDVKRVPYRLSNLRMEILDDVSSADNIYRISILSKEYAIDGVLTKLNLDAGIDWAKRAE